MNTTPRINWRIKFSSRKFWLAIVGFITTLLITFNVPDMTIEKIAGLITAMGSLTAFILAEGWVDAKRAEGEGVEFDIAVEEEVDINDD